MAEHALRTVLLPSPGSAGPARRRAIFEDAVAAIESRYEHDALTVAELARTVFTSKRQLQRAFAEAGTSFQETLHTVRMERGAELLVESSLTVSEIASRVGYRQPTQFAKAFKRLYGLAPTELRSTSSNHETSEETSMECTCGCCETPMRPPAAELRPLLKRHDHERELRRRLKEIDRRLRVVGKAA